MVKIGKEKADKITQAAWYITEKLGYDRATWTLAKKRTYKEGSLEFTIFMDEDNDSDVRFRELSISVEHEGKVVYKNIRTTHPVGRNDISYRQGDWEKELEVLYQKAKRRRRIRQRDSWDFYPGNLFE